MDANAYQEASRRTWQPEPADEPLGHVLDVYYNATQLSGEAGEIAGMIAKWIKFGKSLDREAMKLELGDALWHLTRLGELFGFPLEEIMQANIAKLEERHPTGDPHRWYLDSSLEFDTVVAGALNGSSDTYTLYAGDPEEFSPYTVTPTEANL